MILEIALILATFAALSLLIRTTWALRRYVYRPLEPNALELPSVSVCIAARNETHALARCLERVIRSDYKKLEILVLDDSSSDDTSLIIKSFANAGVRFIAGKPLPLGWLGKNHAYQTLVDEASGDYILFIDVDTTIQPDTVLQLMQQLTTHQKAMLSVLPRREDSYHASALFGTLRYYWELLLGTRISPPSSSALWLIERDALRESKIGLEKYGTSVRLERHLARYLKRANKYYYIIGTRRLGVAYEKRWKSQLETAQRLYYPMSGKNAAQWLLKTSFLLLLLLPFGVLILVQTSPVADVWSFALVIIIVVALDLFMRRTHGAPAWQVRRFILPLTLLQELLLLIYSYTKYQFGVVTWKGRAVNAIPTNDEHITIDE